LKLDERFTIPDLKAESCIARLIAVILCGESRSTGETAREQQDGSSRQCRIEAWVSKRVRPQQIELRGYLAPICLCRQQRCPSPR
jgi:hypothetical protein